MTYQVLPASYHRSLYKHMWQDERQLPQSDSSVPICTFTNSGYRLHGNSDDVTLKRELTF